MTKTSDDCHNHKEPVSPQVLAPHSCCHAKHTENPASNGELKDPVCGMTVKPDSPLRHTHAGQTYFFCGQRCLTKFSADPAAFLDNSAAPAPVIAGAEYTCPMHPEIVEPIPGICTKCGMALESILPTLDEDENPELRDFLQRFWCTLPLTIIVTTLAMFGHMLSLTDAKTQSWIELLLSLPVVLWAGLPFFVRGVQSLIHRSPNMWTLIATGTGSAFIYSVVATVVPQWFPDNFQSMGRIGVYFEAAVVIISLTLLGQILELKARSKTSAAIKSLLGLANSYTKCNTPFIKRGKLGY